MFQLIIEQLRLNISAQIKLDKVMILPRYAREEPCG